MNTARKWTGKVNGDWSDDRNWEPYIDEMNHTDAPILIRLPDGNLTYVEPGYRLSDPFRRIGSPVR